MTDTTTTADEIETETRTKKRVETEIEEIEETYEVTECQWCEGTHPVEDTVAVGVGQSEEAVEREVGTITLENVPTSSDIYFDAADGVTTSGEEYEDLFSRYNGKVNLAVEVEQEFQTSVPYCSYCASDLFGIDRDDALDAPAYKVYDEDDFGTADDTADESVSVSMSWSVDSDVWAAASVALMLTAAIPAVLGLGGITLLLLGLSGICFGIGLLGRAA